jgi:hypothetical protein
LFAQRLKHPNTEDKTLLVYTPDLDGDLPISMIKEGLKTILTQAYVTIISSLLQPSEYGVPRKQKGTKLCAHFWVRSLIFLEAGVGMTGESVNLYNLRTVFQNLVEKDSVIFLTTHWERVDKNSGKARAETIPNGSDKSICRRSEGPIAVYRAGKNDLEEGK